MTTRMLTLKESIQGEDLVFSLWGFLLSQVSLQGDLHCMGLSFLVASFIFMKKQRPLLFFAVLMGALFSGNWKQHLSLLVILFYLLQGISRYNPKKVLLFSSLFFFLGFFFWFSLRSSMPSALLTVGGQVILFLFFVYLFHQGLDAFYLFRAGSQKLQEKQILSLFLFFFLPLLSLSQLQMQSIHLQEILSLFLLFYFSYHWGSGIGAAVGSLLFLSLFFSSPYVVQPIFYPLLGFLCGLLQDQRELGLGVSLAAAVFIVLNLQLESFYRSPRLVEGFWALFLFTLLNNLLRFPVRKRSREEGRRDVESWMLNYSHHLQRLGDVFFDAAVDTMDREDLYSCNFFQDLKDSICSSCVFSPHCYRQGVFHHEASLLSLVEERKTISSKSIGEKVPDCPHSHKISALLNDYGRERGEENPWDLYICIELLSLQSKGLGEALMAMNDVDDNTGLPFLFGLSSWNREQVSGDSCLMKRLPGGRFLVGLSDGLGTGCQAAKKSCQVLEILFQLLLVEIKVDRALHILNLFCCLFYSDEEYSTLDLAIFSPSHPLVTFFKYGAASTFIKRGHQISTIRCCFLPLGITTGQAQPVQRKFQEGDQIIFVSDGILDVCPEAMVKEEWLIEFLKGVSDRDPQQVAHSILEEARGRLTEDLLDDMTVMVVQLDDRKISF